MENYIKYQALKTTFQSSSANQAESNHLTATEQIELQINRLISETKLLVSIKEIQRLSSDEAIFGGHPCNQPSKRFS